MTLAGFARALLACTVIIPWGHPGPCGQARRGRKARHSDPDFRHKHVRATLLAPRHGGQEVDRTDTGERPWVGFPGGRSRTASLQRGLKGSGERLALFIEHIEVGEWQRQ
jgi:hypothetical protein